MSNPTRPLEGLLVVSIDQAVAAPLCASRLAEAGARVIKVERPGGDFARNYDAAAKGQSSYFVWLNRGKESIALDLKDEADAAILRAMIAQADVFIQNLAPGAAARAGFGSEALRAEHPRLITCDISGYGEEGPYAEMKAYDLLIQAETGLASVTGAPEAPGRVGVSLVDIAAGTVAFGAILQALYARERSGEGAALKVSLFDVMADWMTVPLAHSDYGGRAPKRVGMAHPSIAPYEAFETAEGGPIIISIQNEREWVKLCRDALDRPEMAERPEYASNNARVAHREQLHAEIAEVLGKLTRAEAADRLRQAGVAYGALNQVSDLSGHMQLRRATVPTPAGPLELPASPVLFDGVRTPPGAVPALDEHGAALRAEFGRVTEN